MRFWLPAVAFAFMPLPGMGQQDKNAKTDPDLLYKKEHGVSIQKPAKNDEWEFKDVGFFKDMHLVVAHKVDRVFIEIYAQEKAATGYYDPKAAAEGSWKSLSTSPDFKDCKKVAEIKSVKLPNGGANNPMSYLVDMTMKDKDDKPLELKSWSFVGKENQNFYRVVVVGEAGTYKKHQRLLDLMLGSIRLYKVPK